MKLNKSKGSRKHRMRSSGTKEKAPKTNQMSMSRKVTVRAYEREKVVEPESRQEKLQQNKDKMDSHQSGYKPIQQSRRGL